MKWNLFIGQKALRIIIRTIIYSFCILNNSAIIAQEIIERFIVQGDSLEKISQNKEANSVYLSGLALVKEKKQYKKVAVLYKKLGYLSWKEKNYQKAESLYKNSLSYDSVSLNAADCYHNIALTKRKKNEMDSVIPYLHKAINLYDNYEGSDKAYNVFLNTGIIYKNRQQYEESLFYLIKAYEGFRKSENLKKLSSASNSIAQIQNLIGDKEKAFRYYFEALQLRKQLKDTSAIAMSYNNIANAYKGKKEYDSAIFYYDKSLKLKHKNSKSYASTLYNIGISYYLKGNIDAAEKHYKEALQINTHFKNSLSMLYNYNELALLAIEKNKLFAAKNYLEASNILIDKVEVQEVVYRNYEIQALLYSQKKDFRKAFEFQKKHTDLYKSVFNTKQTEIVQTLQEKFESKKKQHENLKLSLENKENHLVIDKQRSKIRINNLLLSVLGLILLLTITAYFLLRQRQNVQKQKQAIRQLEAIFKGQETIKKSIGKDLHDIITTNFDGLRLKLLTLPLAKDIEHLTENIVGEIKDINHQIRLISHRLSPLDDKIKKYKLSTIIKSQLSEFQLYRKIFVNLENEIPTELDELNLEAQTNFYGILLETLNNIGKHSKATELTISSKIDTLNWLHFKISDNGIGLKNTTLEGIGILNIKQRAQLLGGSCNIINLENGVEVSLKFPLNEHIK